MPYLLPQPNSHNTYTHVRHCKQARGRSQHTQNGNSQGGLAPWQHQQQQKTDIDADSQFAFQTANCNGHSQTVITLASVRTENSHRHGPDQCLVNQVSHQLVASLCEMNTIIKKLLAALL